MVFGNYFVKENKKAQINLSLKTLFKITINYISNL